MQTGSSTACICICKRVVHAVRSEASGPLWRVESIVIHVCGGVLLSVSAAPVLSIGHDGQVMQKAECFLGRGGEHTRYAGSGMGLGRKGRGPAGRALP